MSDVQVGKLLAKYPRQIILLFDGDDAGKQGMIKAKIKLVARGVYGVVMAKLPAGKDPDDFSTNELMKLLSEIPA